jgi:hypothetical protein
MILRHLVTANCERFQSCSSVLFSAPSRFKKSCWDKGDSAFLVGGMSKAFAIKIIFNHLSQQLWTIVNPSHNFRILINSNSMLNA